MKFEVQARIDEEWTVVADFRPPYRTWRFLWWQCCFDCASAEAVAAAAATAYAFKLMSVYSYDHVKIIRVDGPDKLTVFDSLHHINPTWERP